MKLTKKAIRQQMRDFIIICGITFALLLLLELLLRVVFSEKVEAFTFKIAEPAYEFNKDYLVALKPSVKKTFIRSKHNGGDKVTWMTNSMGFRGKELRDSSDVRIMVYGDSNIQARFSRYENLFTTQLEEKLIMLANKNIEVINAGTIGAGPDQNLIRFQLEADIYNPDIVIFHIFADNDFGDIIRNRLFFINDKGELQQTNFKRQEDLGLKINKAQSFFGEIWRKVMIFKCCRGLSKAFFGNEEKISGEKLIEKGLLQRENEFKIYQKKEARTISVFADSYDFDLALFPQKKSSRIKIKLMAGVLNAAKIFAEQKGIKFLVLIQPSPFDLNKGSSPNYIDAEKYTAYKKGNLVDFTDKACDMNGIPRVNLYQIFLKEGSEDLFFKADNHWSDMGQKLAAIVVAGYIQRTFLSNRKMESNKQ